MKQPAIRKSLRPPKRDREAGVTIVLVAAALTAALAMAALSIDVVTLYLADANAQQAADAAALAGARILSLSGMTGDPQNASGLWSAACTSAQDVATAVGNQITVGGTIPAGITVTFPNDTSGNCSGAGLNKFGVNPKVQVKIQSTSLPTFFARIWGKTGSTVSATATAEVFNPSNSGAFSGSGIIPVQPRCVKPWIVPNIDPGNYPNPFVSNVDGSINSASQGIRLSGATPGIVGEQFALFAGCSNAVDPCIPMTPDANVTSGTIPPTPPPPVPPNLIYFPGEAPAFSVAVPSGATGTTYEAAVGGCDQKTIYQCGVPNASAGNPNKIDLSENPGGGTGDTAVAVQILIHQAGGQDALDTAKYPYQIKTGAGNPLTGAGLASGSLVTSSNSIVSLPIYDNATPINPTSTTPVTIVGFLQVFVNQVNADGSLSVTVLNVSGCSNAATQTALTGTSPVPIRLITYP